MADNPITGVLSLLRLFKYGSLTPGNTISDHVRTWVGEGPTEAQVARVYSYALDLVEAAEDVIRQSQLNEEAQQGLIQTTEALRRAFAIQSAGAPLQNFLPALEAAITSFSILSSATGLTGAGESAAKEVAELIADVEKMSLEFEAADLDPLVKDVARRHLRVLALMLRNIEVFGVDGAMTAYSELVIRLQRSGKTASPTTGEKVAKLWPEVERWAGRLAVIDQAVNHGQALLGHVGHVISLLPHLPGGGG